MRGWSIALVTGILLVAAALAAGCLIWPAISAVRDTLATPNWSDAGLSARRLGLLARGIGVAAAAAVLAQILGAGLAAGLVRQGGRATLWSLTAFVSLVVLLTPPYIYAFAWSLVLLPGGSYIGAAGAIRWPAWLVHEGRAVWCLATWTAPVAAVVLAAGWRSAGRPAFALAVPDGGTAKALLHGALPALRPWLGLGLIATGLLAITEHAVSDLCQVQTWNTEVLSLVQSWNAPGLLLGWPMLAVAVAILLAAIPFRGAIRSVVEDLAGLRTAEEVAPVTARRRNGAAAIVAVCAAGILLLPWLILALQMQNWAAFARVWQSFPHEGPHGLRYAAVAGGVGIWLAAGMDLLLSVGNWRILRWAGWGMIVLAGLAAIAPPALVGDAISAAYLRWPAIGDRWPVVSLTTAARFAIIPIIGLRIAGVAAGVELARMAAVDGADRVGAWWRVQLPLGLPVLLACGVVVALLALTEVPASHMVRPAGVESVAVTLFNFIHYGRNDEIVAMSLYVMGFVATIVFIMQVLARACRQSKTTRPTV